MNDQADDGTMIGDAMQQALQGHQVIHAAEEAARAKREKLEADNPLVCEDCGASSDLPQDNEVRKQFYDMLERVGKPPGGIRCPKCADRRRSS